MGKGVLIMDDMTRDDLSVMDGPVVHGEDWFKQDEKDVPLGDLPEYWEHNRPFMTPGAADALTERVCEEYYDLYRRYSPEYYDDVFSGSGLSEEELAGKRPGEDEWVRRQHGFFETVRTLERWDVRAHCDSSPGWFDKRMVTGRFGEMFPEYVAWATNDAIEQARERRRSQQEGPQAGLFGGFDLSRGVDAPSEPAKTVEKQAEAGAKPGKAGSGGKHRDFSGLTFPDGFEPGEPDARPTDGDFHDDGYVIPDEPGSWGGKGV